MDFNLKSERPYRSAAQLSVAVLTAAMVSACIQTTATPDRPASRAFVQRSATPQEVATVTPRKQRTRTASRSLAASHGMASFYRHGSRTASGEKFNPGELTAAHRTLPFGTKVRVTDVATGKSVTVRVNDRGPFIDGRVIDVSHAAAQSLGMTGKGVAKVKLDVVQ
ncbi:MAG: septal ring lytic transglycosylase RlpA family protein [Xanthobacteraceae bacterium]|nr:septal ring lytic transglycosylase RlpA family protein [Xanthobacteraceae bacterium]